MKFLGLLDILAALLLIGKGIHLNIPQGLIIFIAFYLFIKAIVFLADIGSAFDIAGGIFLILTLFINIPWFILIIPAVLIGSKGIMSLFA